MFHSETQMWRRFFVFDQPTARDCHTLTKVDTTFYLYGGNVSPENLILDEMWMLDLNRVPWESK